MKKSELRSLIREQVKAVLKESVINESINTVTIKTKDGTLHHYPNFKKADVISFLTKNGMKQVYSKGDLSTNLDFYIVESFISEKEDIIKEEITLNSPSFKKLVAKVQEISDKSGNNWDELKKYLKSKYPFFETYTTGTNPEAYVVNFFAITKGKDADVKKKPQDYVEIGEWYIRPW